MNKEQGMIKLNDEVFIAQGTAVASSQWNFVVALLVSQDLLKSLARVPRVRIPFGLRPVSWVWFEWWTRNKECWNWMMNKEQGMLKLNDEGLKIVICNQASELSLIWIMNKECWNWIMNKEWWNWIMNNEQGMLKLNNEQGTRNDEIE